MNLGEKLTETKKKLKLEEIEAVSTLKDGVYSTINSFLENWLRSGYKSVVVYPLSLAGKEFIDLIPNNLTSANESNFTKAELDLWNYLKNDQNLVVASCMYGDKLVISINL